MSKKVVRITRISENELVNLIDGIVAEAVAEQKKEWIAETKVKNQTILETKIKELETKIIALTEAK